MRSQPSTQLGKEHSYKAQGVCKGSGVEREFAVATERQALSCEQEEEGWPLSFGSGQDLSLRRSCCSGKLLDFFPRR